MRARVTAGAGFLAALDQSAGSTPAALRRYGVPGGACRTDAQMFRAMHAMRVRIMTAPDFTGERILGVILFVGTMDGTIEGAPTPSFLWARGGIVSFVKVDQGLEAEAAGVQLMKPTPDLPSTLRRAGALGVFGTKTRSVIHRADEAGIGALVDQQFELAERICREGFCPIVEPEVLIASPEKAAAEALLRDALLRRLDALPRDCRILLKLTLPETPDLYRPVAARDAVVRLVALSGGYPRDEACARLARNHGMVASFSRALIQDLRVGMTKAQFDAAMRAAIGEIYAASLNKAPG